MREKWHCKKKGITCPYTTVNQQVVNCENWDPRDFMCDDTCRHARTAAEQAAAGAKSTTVRMTAWPGTTSARTPEDMLLVRKTNENTTKETVARIRIEQMKRQTAAAERIAAALEDIANAIRKGGTK